MPIYIRSGVDFKSLESVYQAVTHGALGSNLGNMLFQEAVCGALDLKNEELIAVGHDLYHKQADTINARGKALILPLANLFRNEFERKINEYAELIERLSIPVVVVGVGCQTDLNYSLDLLRPIDKSVKRFSRAVLERSASIGVRGECTYNYLKSLGFNDVEVIGCPSMYSHGGVFPELKKVKDVGDNVRFALNISSSIRQCEFSTGIESAAKLIDVIFSRFPRAEIFPQEQRTLEAILYRRAGFFDELSALSDNTKKIIEENDGLSMFFDSRSWVSYLKGFDVSFGTRIHGNIASILAGVPSVVFAHDSRTLELCEFHNIPALKAGGSLDVDCVLEAAGECDVKIAKEYGAKYINFRNFLKRNGVSIVASKTEGAVGMRVSPPLKIKKQYAHGVFNTFPFVKARRFFVKRMRKYGNFKF